MGTSSSNVGLKAVFPLGANGSDTPKRALAEKLLGSSSAEASKEGLNLAAPPPSGASSSKERDFLLGGGTIIDSSTLS